MAAFSSTFIHFFWFSRNCYDRKTRAHIGAPGNGLSVLCLTAGAKVMDYSLDRFDPGWNWLQNAKSFTIDTQKEPYYW